MILALSSVEIVHKDVVFTISLRESNICSGVMVQAYPRDKGSRTACTPGYESSVAAAADRIAANFVCGTTELAL